MPLPIQHVLIANRGEIAIRIARSAAEMGIHTTGVHTEDDRHSPHVAQTDQAVLLPGQGPVAFMDGQHLIEIARTHGCDAIHPGYGFLSEDPDFARLCEEQGLAFIGPSSRVLSIFGDKTLSRKLAQRCHVPLVPGTSGASSLHELRHFMEDLGGDVPIMIKALAGGGGRGMRAVHNLDELDEAYRQASAEAGVAFGNTTVYGEQLVPRARHIEIQVVGNGYGDVVHLGERDCSLQRRRQKLIEMAPAPELSDDCRHALAGAALKMAREVRYRGVGTFEFLVEAERPENFYFLECNPRIQVEHTVTEAVTGVDLVRTQFAIAGGQTLKALGLTSAPEPNGFAVQSRVYLERIDADGQSRPAAGRITGYDSPGGPGLRIDDCGYAGYQVPIDYDTLIAKVITHAPEHSQALQRNQRALGEFRLDGVASNLTFLQATIQHVLEAPSVPHTGTIEHHISELAGNSRDEPGSGTDEGAEATDSSDRREPIPDPPRGPTQGTDDRSPGAVQDEPLRAIPEGMEEIRAPASGRVVTLMAEKDQRFQPGETLLVVEAMKMEFPLRADRPMLVTAVFTAPGEAVHEGETVLLAKAEGEAATEVASEGLPDADYIRPDLAEVHERHHVTLDEGRPEAVEKRHARGRPTVRENLGELLDEGSFREYGALAVAAQRRRRAMDDLIRRSPADGLVAGTGTINGELFGADRTQCLALAYDYTVFAGTQGVMNHKKTDRLLKLAAEWSLPVVLLAEGGGGRPGDSDYLGVSGLDVPTFVAMARLSGQVPLVSVVSGRCFAGNAALAGCSDVIIGTRDSTLGMAGPAMIEGGGLGRFRPEEIGPATVQGPNGVLDLIADDDRHAMHLARQYLGYFQGVRDDWECDDQRLLRHRIPEERTRVYDIRTLIDNLADDGSVLELRKDFAPPMLTALIRIEGQPMGLIANDPARLGGAIDAECADKAARFMQLCNAHALPLLSLCDTPGFMVGPDSEKQGAVRHVSRMFVTAASLRVPFFTVVLRKGYGLGAQAMAAGSFHSPLFTIAWPSGEFGAMGLEGAVRLGYAEELAAVEDAEQRQALFQRMVDQAYEQGKAINTASFLEIDAVIDPVDTRQWILSGLKTAARGKQRPDPAGFVDTW